MCQNRNIMLIRNGRQLPPGISEVPGKQNTDRIRVTDAAGHRRIETYKSYQRAEEILIQRKMEALKGKLPGRRNRIGIAVSTLIDDAINYAFRNNDEYSARDLRRKLEHIRNDFGLKDASSVTRQHITEWLDKKMAEHNWKPSSRNRYLSAFSLVFRLAIDAGKLEYSPTLGIKHLAEHNRRIRILSKDEENRLIAAVRELYPQNLAVLTLSLHTGMRRSEQLRCLVGDFDFETGLLMVRQKKNRTGAPERYVPLTPIGISAYKELCAGREKGELLYTDNIPYWFDQCVAKAGITDFTWHALRHTFISRMVMSGVPIAVVAQFVGHSSHDMTMRYSHLIPEQNKEAVAKLMTYYE